MKTAEYWIETLELVPYARQGYIRETYRSADSVPAEGLPGRFGGQRSMCTAIYYLLKAGQAEPLHRLKADELWHFYAGGALLLHLFHPDGRYERLRVGPDPEQGDRLQVLAPAGAWFGATPAPGSPYALVGCTVSPGFDSADFELGEKEKLVEQFPEQKGVIEILMG